ncbi:uncharacterized protein TEOVI_000732700 [Trypanosoma equiperdum]|uniref:Uncharacterized protein n=1 Tax=Trypanosoma equiperdum TaxID=5694 RepID=A0A1G4I1F0_TRYEQ|nr:hypothetical protein, conserved [Trypanosoma equiperdum]
MEGFCYTAAADAASEAKGGVPQLPHLSAAALGKASSRPLPHPAAAITTVELPSGSVVIAGGGSVISVEPLSSLLQSCSKEGECEACNDPLLGGVAVHSTVPGEKVTLTISSGLVSCIGTALLPGGTAAMCAVGTSAGSLCLFVVESRTGGNALALCKVCEASLCEYTDGLISADDIVLDVCVGLDPAGRPEFVAVATATVVVVIDTQCFNESLRANATEAVLRETVGSWQRTPCPTEKPVNETFYASFTASEVVRLLVPQRYRASFAVDIALLIVFDNGELRYVARRVVGGSLQLLTEHHRQRQLRHSTVGLGMLQHNSEGPIDGSHGSLALPHVLYAYSLSSVVHNVCTAAVGVSAATYKVVNNAALFFDDMSQTMRIIVVGAGTQLAERYGHQLRGTTGWWAITGAAVLARGTLDQRQLAAWGFDVPCSGALPRDRRGLACITVLEGGRVLFACGNELYVCTMADATNAVVDGSSGGGGGAYVALRQVHTCGSVVCGVACTGTRIDGRNVGVIGFGASLAALLF